jgi:hypothetical protein
VGASAGWRFRHAADTLEDAGEAVGEPLGQLVEQAISGKRRELLAHTLSIAHDTALRDKRRALGRAPTAGITGGDAEIDAELL